MATLVSRSRATSAKTETLLRRVSLTGAVVSSRLLVAAAGIAGGLSTRVVGWRHYDPFRVSNHLGSAGDLIAATSVRWDSIHYLEIAAHGYGAAPNSVFFPMYPLLIHMLAWIVQSAVLAGALISTMAFIVALMLLHRLTVEELSTPAAPTTVLLLAFAPLSFFFTAIYAESLFLALSVGSFYLARRGRFGFAGLLAAGATLTRIPGIVLVIPLAMMYLEANGPRPWLELRRNVVGLGAISLSAIALGGFLVYLHSRGYGWLAPVTNQLTSRHGHSMTGPLVGLWRGIDTGLVGFATLASGHSPVAPGLQGPFTIGAQNFVYLVILGIAVASLVGAWRRLPRAYAVYSALVLIVCVWSPSPVLPLRSLDRYALDVFPLWMVAGAWLQERRRALPVVLGGSGALLVFYCVLAARWVFIA